MFMVKKYFVNVKFCCIGYYCEFYFIKFKNSTFVSLSDSEALFSDFLNFLDFLTRSENHLRKL